MLSSSLLVLVVLVSGTVALAAVFTAGRLRDVDSQTRALSDATAALLASGQLPSVLPVPVGSPLLAQVLADDGSVLAATPSASRTQSLLELAGRGRDVVTDEHGSYAGVPLRLRRTRARLGDQPVVIVVAAPLGDVRRALHSLRSVLLVLVPLLVGAAGLTVWWVAGRALRPVERLRLAAEQLAQGPHRGAELAELPASSGDDEIARLGRTLNELLAALRVVLQQQSAFVEDAAHELRSPLASMRVQLDVAAAHPELVELPQLVEDLGHEAARLTVLTDDLLVLARMETGPALAAGAVDLTRLAGAPGAPVRVVGDEPALRRLVDNLLVNARRLAGHVEAHTWTDGTFAVLDIDDDGPGIPVADRQRIFDRWVRLDPARARADGGAGLGLAVVREIARRHGGDVAAMDSPLGGARLRVRLPAAAAADTGA